MGASNSLCDVSRYCVRGRYIPRASEQDIWVLIQRQGRSPSQHLRSNHKNYLTVDPELSDRTSATGGTLWTYQSRKLATMTRDRDIALGPAMSHQTQRPCAGARSRTLERGFHPRAEAATRLKLPPRTASANLGLRDTRSDSSQRPDESGSALVDQVGT